MSNFGHFPALETPGGDLGFQGSILEHFPGERRVQGHHFGMALGHFWGLFFEVLFWKASGSRV